MEIKQLQCFIAAAEELNFTIAAERLYLSQPSLSRHIHNLEEELGLLLFTRDKKNVELTNAGIQLLANARDIVGSAGELVNTARELNLGKTGKLRIGYQGSACGIVPTILYQFLHRYPNINISVEEYGAKELTKKLRNGEVDLIIAFSIAAEIQEHEDIFNHTHLMDDDLALFIGQNTAEVFGDYASGTNHTLPTLRAARYTGGVWVGTFLKTCTHQSMTPEASARIAPLVSRMAHGEGLSGHAAAADARK